ncbi:MAG TPA: hypothetical protein VFP38_12705 [Bradyrhizobium sp.]|nr:hypothetical protein [Bradyrhizobium sp.]
MNSITACDLLIAADCANASRAAELLFHKGIKIPFKMQGRARLDTPKMPPSGSPLTHIPLLQALIGW